jgi:periplasmic divalent cation tolerance protein
MLEGLHRARRNQKRNREADMSDEIMIFITAASDDEAVTIARALVSDRLVACANIVPHVRSVFFWEGKVCDENEILIIGKSKSPLMPQIIQTVKSLHSYTVPEIIAVPVVEGSPEYLAWLRETVKK